MRKWLERFRDAFNWGWLAYRIIWILAATGILSAVGGTVWAVLIGVPLPIAIMAGYCTLVGAVYLAIAPLAYRALANSPANSRAIPIIAPDYRLWRLKKVLTLSQAAHLWNNRDPSIVVGTPDIEGIFELFKEAIQSGSMPIVLSPGSNSMIEVAYPDKTTRVNRESLKQFAKTHGYDPAFLRDA
jgi:hypothetical protein